MNKYLSKKIWEMRKNIKPEPDTPLVSLMKIADGVYQLLFLSIGCRNSCTFCNYGFDYVLTLLNVMPELRKITLSNDIKILELEANGSFMDEREIPYDLFLETLKFVAHKVPKITIETHYKTITEKKIQDIRSILGWEQDLSFEVGLESVNERVRKIYNKDIDLKEFLKVAELCERYGASIEANILLGAPFLTREEQIQDCLNSLEWLYTNMPKGTTAVLFPINIKENTMVWLWRERGLYKQITSWEFVELLRRIPEEYLDRLTIAWWGERENAFTKDISTFPITCEKCKKRLMRFYNDFYNNCDIDYRKRIIDEIWKSHCECDKAK